MKAQGGRSPRAAQWGRGWRRSTLRRHLLLRRRLVAAVLIGLTIVGTLQMRWRTMSAESQAMMSVAARDLAAGSVVGAADVRQVPWPPAELPSGVIGPVPGLVTTSAIRRGEPFTDARVQRAGITGSLPADRQAVVVPVDAATGGLIRPGMSVNLYAAGLSAGPDLPSESGQARLAAADVPVLSLLDASSGTQESAPLGGLGTSGIGQDATPALVLSVSMEQARSIAAMRANSSLVVTISAAS